MEGFERAGKEPHKLLRSRSLRRLTVTVSQVKNEPEDGLIQGQKEPAMAWEDIKTFLAHFEGTGEASPPTSRLFPKFGEAEEALRSLGVRETYGKTKAAILRGEARSVLKLFEEGSTDSHKDEQILLDSQQRELNSDDYTEDTSVHSKESNNGVSSENEEAAPAGNPKQPGTCKAVLGRAKSISRHLKRGQTSKKQHRTQKEQAASLVRKTGTSNIGGEGGDSVNTLANLAFESLEPCEKEKNDFGDGSNRWSIENEKNSSPERNEQVVMPSQARENVDQCCNQEEHLKNLDKSEDKQESPRGMRLTRLIICRRENVDKDNDFSTLTAS
ncbi:hypothetical protein JD844_013721 [Phrynosoma platyrhinos]|uniref:Uncharacterized protein n=1 Tax=Phrynosoma platyrhinos TaxID=52577 RepID=A0ABQ7TL83_PHRPL|nr:hypothetical protein JD844_013721 [Phrynosoma platyrhinos]